MPDPIKQRFDSVRQIADAVLYEGYLLYPYRHTSTKNRGPRWQFGVLSPKSAIRADPADDVNVAGSVESWFQQTHCLLESPPRGDIGVRIRFLHLLRRTVERVRDDGAVDDVPEVDVDGRLYVAFDEAVAREHDVWVDAADLLRDERHVDVHVAAHETVEPIVNASGAVAAFLRRRREPLAARVILSMKPAAAPFPLYRLAVRIENIDQELPAQAGREAALARSLISTHTFISMPGARFLSLLDPPHWAEQAVQECANIHTFPVLGGDSALEDLVISSPIIMYDHPAVAPESQGDFFDATEIDELLSLRAMTMSDVEMREARAADPRSAEILDRVAEMPPELLAKLHGAVRSMRPLAKRPSHTVVPRTSVEDPELPWWTPEAEARVRPEVDAAPVAGGLARKGRVVRLRPRRRGADAHDMFLVGHLARVERVLLDVDGGYQLAVTVTDDPAAELHQWYGRFHFFAPDEVELITDEPEQVP